MALIRSNVGYIVKDKYSSDNRLRLRPKLRELLESDDYEERRKGLLVAKGLVESNKDISEFYTLIYAIRLWDHDSVFYQQLSVNRVYHEDNTTLARELIECITQTPGSWKFYGNNEYWDDLKSTKKFVALIFNSNSQSIKDVETVTLLNAVMDDLPEWMVTASKKSHMLFRIVDTERELSPFIIRLISEKTISSLFLALHFSSMKESYVWDEIVPNFGRAITVILGLGEIGDKRAVKPLFKRFTHLSDHDKNAYCGEIEGFEQQALIARSLGKIGDYSAVGPLIEALNWCWGDDDVCVPEIALALGTIGDIRAVEPLVDHLYYSMEADYIHNSGYDLAVNSAWAIGEMRDKRAIAALNLAAKFKGNDKVVVDRFIGNLRAFDVRNAAETALRKIHDAIE